MPSRRSISARFWPYCPNSEEASRLSSKVRIIWAVLSGATKIDSSVSGVRNSGSCAKKSGFSFRRCFGCSFRCSFGSLHQRAQQAVAGSFGDNDGGNLADERLGSGHRHRLQIGRAADDLAFMPARLFEQDIEALANAASIERFLLTVDDVLQTLQPLRFHIFRHLVVHLGARCAWPPRILERERAGEPDVGDQAQCFGEIALGFTGKADDEVRCQSKIGPRLAQPPHDIEIIGAGVVAVHGRENSIGARLDWKMQLRHELRQIAMYRY